jgi:hypothetical protein
LKTIQRHKILSLLQSKTEVSLPEILDLRISQFGARILELRREGYNIINRTKVIDGVKCSWYRLELDNKTTL